jgi:hypothetical protein
MSWLIAARPLQPPRYGAVDDDLVDHRPASTAVARPAPGEQPVEQVGVEAHVGVEEDQQHAAARPAWAPRLRA